MRFLGEEGGAQCRRQKRPGSSTQSTAPAISLAGIPVWCVSLGPGREVATSSLGVIYNPVTDETYAARAAPAPRCNGKRIRVSGRKAGRGAHHARLLLSPAGGRAVNAVMPASTPAANTPASAPARWAWPMPRMAASMAITRPHINAWDVAAGMVIVTEAGGWHNDFFGRPDPMAKGNRHPCHQGHCWRSRISRATVVARRNR